MPLGLCNTQYKILTQILANRLKPHLTCLISPFQVAFTPGGLFADLFTIVHETMHSLNASKKREGWLILKIDFKKAFDSISWTFIDKILHLYNFLHQYIELLLSCPKNVQYTPIINGKKTASFSPYRGIGQGDPISPYIFILAMQYLTKLIIDKLENRSWTPFKFRNNPLPVSLL